MKQFSLFTTSFLFFYLISLTSYAQKQPMKFGKIDKDDLLMKECEIDKEADAMVLCEYGTINFKLNQDVGFQTVFTKHVRMKIFTKKGYDHANVTIPFYKQNGNSKEVVTSVKAASYHLNGNKIVETKLSSKDVFEEQLSKHWNVKKFAIPNVKEGAIIEFSYRITSGFINNLRNWEFQKLIPVKWSEYRVTIPEWFKYKPIFRGNYTLFSVNDQVNVPENFLIYFKGDVSQGELPTQGGSTTIPSNSTYNRWVVENLPALKLEPYTASPKDYATQLEFQLLSYQLPGGPLKTVATSYEGFNNKLAVSSNISELLKKGNAFLHKTADEVTSGASTKQEKAVAIYEHVKNRMSVTSHAYSPSTAMKKIYDSKEGNVADINFMMAVMMKHVGVNVDPIILNTRAQGRPHPQFPSEERFNYVVFLVDIDGHKYLADAAYSDALPFGMLPEKCLNGSGWKVSKSSPGWVDLQSGAKDKSTYFVNLTLADGKLAGNVSITQQKYSALESRLEGTDVDKTTEALKEVLTDWEVDEVKWTEAKNIYKPLNLSFNIAQEDMDDDRIYLNTNIYGLEDKNPFKSETRNLPIDFPFAQSRRYVLSITIPEGYTVEELPKPARVTLPNKGGSFMFNASQNGQTITIINNLNIKQKLFQVSEYKILRQFFEMLVAKNAEQIVIKKVGE